MRPRVSAVLAGLIAAQPGCRCDAPLIERPTPTATVDVPSPPPAASSSATKPSAAFHLYDPNPNWLGMQAATFDDASRLAMSAGADGFFEDPTQPSAPVVDAKLHRWSFDSNGDVRVQQGARAWLPRRDDLLSWRRACELWGLEYENAPRRCGRWSPRGSFHVTGDTIGDGQRIVAQLQTPSPTPMRTTAGEPFWDPNESLVGRVRTPVPPEDLDPLHFETWTDVWDAKSGRLVATWHWRDSGQYARQWFFGPVEDYLIASGSDGGLDLYRFRQGVEVLDPCDQGEEPTDKLDLVGKLDYPRMGALSVDAHAMVPGVPAVAVRGFGVFGFIDLHTLRCRLRVFGKGFEGAALAHALSPAGDVMAIVDGKGLISVWAIPSLDPRGEWNAHFPPRRYGDALSFSPDGKLLLVVNDSRLTLVNLGTKELLHIVPITVNGQPRTLVYTPAGHLDGDRDALATASYLLGDARCEETPEGNTVCPWLTADELAKRLGRDPISPGLLRQMLAGADLPGEPPFTEAARGR